MNKPESSIARAWLSRARRPAAERSVRDRLDLVLPSGWPDSRSPVLWRWQRRGGVVETGEVQELDQMPADARRAPAFVWTPAAETIFTRAVLPTRSPRKIMQALPFALEERLLGDPESLHFAWRAEGDGSLSVAVTNRARIQTWVERFGKSGIQPLSLCPATLLVPWAVDGWSLAFLGNEILVRTGALSGFVCPQSVDAPPGLLAAAAAEATRKPEPPEMLIAFGTPPNFPAELWSKVLGMTVRPESGSVWDKQGEPAAPINLLQGQFEQRTAINESLRPFRWTLVLLVLWLVSSLALDLTDWWTLRREQATLQREMTNILMTSFPETRTVLDPAAQMQRAMEQLTAHRGQNDRELLPMLAKVAAAMRAEPHVRLRNLRYSDQALTIDLTWTAPATPDSWKPVLESNGLHAEILSVTPHGNDTEGRLRLTAGGTARSGT